MDKPTTQQSPRYKRRPSDEESLTPKNRKRKKSESSSGDENWLRPDKCCKCSQTFSDNQVKWNKHNIEKHIQSHNPKIDNSPNLNNSPKISSFFSKYLY